MKFLCIETSTKYCVVAVAGDQGLISGERAVFEKGRSDGLFFLIERCLKKAKIEIGSIGCFGAGVGPGSFTGIRIGLSAAKGLGFATRRSCVPFSSLDAIAGGCSSEFSGRLCVLVDAKRESFYANLYEKKEQGGVVSPVRLFKEDRLIERKKFPGFLKRFARGIDEIVFSGDGVGLLEKITERFEKKQFLPQEFWYPTPESISRLTREGFRAGRTADAFALSAVYLFTHDCQVRVKR